MFAVQLRGQVICGDLHIRVCVFQWRYHCLFCCPVHSAQRVAIFYNYLYDLWVATGMLTISCAALSVTWPWPPLISGLSVLLVYKGTNCLLQSLVELH